MLIELVCRTAGLLGRLADAAVAHHVRHDWENALNLSPGSPLGVLRCRRCGEVVYPEDRDEVELPCRPRRHDWRPIKVFQWEHVALAHKLRVPLQCSRCRETALRRGEVATYGCGGGRVAPQG